MRRSLSLLGKAVSVWLHSLGVDTQERNDWRAASCYTSPINVQMRLTSFPTHYCRLHSFRFFCSQKNLDHFYEKNYKDVL